MGFCLFEERAVEAYADEFGWDPLVHGGHQYRFRLKTLVDVVVDVLLDLFLNVPQYFWVSKFGVTALQVKKQLRVGVLLTDVASRLWIRTKV